MPEVFDHEKHCRNLEEAERELQNIGKHALAGAVGRARAIHYDMISRIATAKREAKRIADLGHRASDIARTIGSYVTKQDGPWIGCVLFPNED